LVDCGGFWTPGSAGTATVRVEVRTGGGEAASGVGSASTDVEGVIIGAATGGGVAEAIQSHTAEALVTTASAEATPHPLTTQSWAADCNAAALEH